MNSVYGFVMNHTSEDHEWAQKARIGEGEYMSGDFSVTMKTNVREYEENSATGISGNCTGEFHLAS